MASLVLELLKTIEGEHRDLTRELSDLRRVLVQDEAASSAWAARLRGELHHLTPRLERHFQREERHFRLLAAEHPELDGDFAALNAEHEELRTALAAIFDRALAARDDSLRSEVSARLERFAHQLEEHERREMAVLGRLT